MYSVVMHRSQEHRPQDLAVPAIVELKSGFKAACVRNKHSRKQTLVPTTDFTAGVKCFASGLRQRPTGNTGRAPLTAPAYA